MRHTYATLNYHRGMDIYTIQGNLGHASISTTELYVNKTNPHARDEAEKVTPLLNTFIPPVTPVLHNENNDENLSTSNCPETA